MVKALLNMVFLLIAAGAAGQENLDADRPGESRTPELVKGNHLQIEAGIRKEKISGDQMLYQHPSATLRFGLFNAIELRMDLLSQTIKDDLSKQNRSGLTPLEFGIKAKVLPEYKWYPSIAVLGLVGFPSTASKDYYNRRMPFEFRTLFAKTLSDKLKIQYNGGVKWEGDERKAEWMYSFSPIFKVTDRFDLFIEEYAFIKKLGPAEHYFDGGVSYYLNKDFMVDISAGAGLSKNSSDYFLSAGFSIRLPK
jgi:hypothetical protein